MPEWILPLKEITCQKCGSKELRRGTVKYCWKCAKISQAAKPKPRAKQHIPKRPATGDQSSRYFIGPHREKFYTCPECGKWQPDSNIIRRSKHNLICKECSAAVARGLAIRKGFGPRKYVKKLSQEQENRIIAWVNRRGG